MSEDTPKPGDAYYHSSTFEVVYHVTNEGRVLTFTQYPDVSAFREEHGSPDEFVDAIANLPSPENINLYPSDE